MHKVVTMVPVQFRDGSLWDDVLMPYCSKTGISLNRNFDISKVLITHNIAPDLLTVLVEPVLQLIIPYCAQKVAFLLSTTMK